METVLYTLLLLLSLFSLYYIFIHKNDGVIQRATAYGSIFKLRTYVYVNGKLIHVWNDEIADELIFHSFKEKRKKQGILLYDIYKNIN